MAFTLPDELVANRVLPTLRALLARELAGLDWSQDAIAERLGVSQAAVSKYLSERMHLEPVIAGDDDVHGTTQAIAVDLDAGRLDAVELLARTMALVRRLENRGPVCTLHEAAMPALEGLGCDLCVNPDSDVAAEAAVLTSLGSALRRLPHVDGLAPWVPHVGSNFCVAMPDASDRSRVAAVPGRIDADGGRLRVPAAPAWGASRHVAEVLLAAHRTDPTIQAAVNLAYRPHLVEAARGLDLSAVEFDAAYEARTERLAEVVADADGVDVLYHRGAFGIEPVAYVLGPDPDTVVDRVRAIVDRAGDAGPMDVR